MAETAVNLEIKGNFEERYYNDLRKQKMARSIGELAIGTGLERRGYHEITSGFSEAIDGVIRTDWKLKINDGKILAEDGQALENLAHNGLQDAMRVASDDRFYSSFLACRARHELDEIRELQAIAEAGADYNTIITLSPYTEELATSAENNGKLRRANQKPDWQRAMIRVSRIDNEGLHLSTRSIDNSSVELLREVAKRGLGYEFQANNSTDMLGERVYLALEDNSIVDELVREADTILSELHGGVWKQGRSEKTHDTQRYVESQQTILQEFFTADEQLALRYPSFESYKQARHKLLYNYSALLEARLLKDKVDNPMHDVGAAAEASGAIARSEGKVYDMCGLVLAPDGTQTQNLGKTGFESLQRYAGQEVKCPACQEKVVMPKAKLEKGILCCPACQYEVDACTGEVHKKPKLKTEGHEQKNKPKQETDWQRIVREDNEKKAQLKQGQIAEHLAKKAA